MNDASTVLAFTISALLLVFSYFGDDIVAGWRNCAVALAAMARWTHARISTTCAKVARRISR